MNCFNTNDKRVELTRKAYPLQTQKEKMWIVNSADLLQLIDLLRNQENFST